MKTLKWVLFYLCISHVFVAKGQLSKATEDSLIVFITKDKPGQHWRIENTRRNFNLSDSTLLTLFRLDFAECMNINRKTNITNVEWFAIQAKVNEGIILEHLGADSSEVLPVFRQAFHLSKKIGQKGNLLWSSIRIAKHYLNIGVLNTTEEIYYYTLVDSLVKNEKLLPEARYLGYRYLGNRHTRYNDFNKAFQYYYQAYEMAKLKNDVELIVKLCNNLLLITERTSDTTGNNRLITETLSFIPEEEYYYQALYYSNLAGYDFLIDSEKKKEYLDKALYNFNLSQNKEHLITLYMLIGDYYYEQDNVDSMGFYNQKIKKTLAELSPTQIYYNDVFTKIYESKYLNLIGEYTNAVETLDTALIMSEKKNAFLVIPGILEIKYQMAQENGDYRSALTYLQAYKALNDSLNSIEKQTQYQNLNVKFETERKQKTINSLENEKKLNGQVLKAQKHTNYVLSISLGALILLLVGLFYVLSQNRKKSKSLQLLNNVKDKIFTVLSHDLRAPLYTFNSLIEIGKMKAISPEENQKYLEMIQNEVGNTSMLLESLLKWSENNLNQLQVYKTKISLNTLLESLKNRVLEHSKRNKVTVNLDINDALSIESDEDMLRFILRNITFNAIKFSPDHGTVIISAYPKNGKTHITISDEGVGMSQEQVQAFFDGNMEASIDAVGDKSTGLGLLLVKEFSEKLNLTIQIDSTMSKGTTFTIIL